MIELQLGCGLDGEVGNFVFVGKNVKDGLGLEGVDVLNFLSLDQDFI